MASFQCVLFFASLVSLTSMFVKSSYADYRDPVGRTNINKQTTLFQDSIENWNEFRHDIETEKENLDFTQRHYIVGNDNLDDTISSLSSIKASELEDIGRDKLLQSDDQIFQDNDDMHAEDAEIIARASARLNDSIISKLKDVGIECGAQKGPQEIEPSYHMDIAKKIVKDTYYDRKTCEDLKNRYSCKEELKLKCTSVVSKPFLINITDSTIPIIKNSDGYAEFGSYNSHWLHGGLGRMYHYQVNFDITHLDRVMSFKIGDINYDDFVLIRLNDQYVYSGPYGGDSLELVPWAFSSLVVVDGKNYNPEQSTWFFSKLDKEMKQYLVEGQNTLSIKLVVGGKGGLRFNLIFLSQKCDNWSETLEESCSLLS